MVVNATDVRLEGLVSALGGVGGVIQVARGRCPEHLLSCTVVQHRCLV